MKLALCYAATLLFAVAAGCGSGDSGPSAAEERRERERRIERKLRLKAERCANGLEDFKDALNELDSRLGVGLSYDEYTTEVGDVKVEYDRIDFEDINDLDCLQKVGVPLENAFKQYADAAGVWGDCFEDINCDNDSIQPELQAHWAKATTLIEKADRGLSP